MLANPWDRRPDETARAHDAFLRYCQLGSSRSLESTRQSLGRVSGYVRVLEEWSSKYDWVGRARAWDAHRVAESQKGIDAATREAGIDWIKRRDQLQQRVWDAADLLFRRATEFANLPTVRVTKDIDGRPVKIEPIDVTGLRQAASVLETATRMARDSVLGGLGLDLPVPRPKKPIDEMSADELDEYRQELQESLAGAGRSRAGTPATDGRRL